MPLAPTIKEIWDNGVNATATIRPYVQSIEFEDRLGGNAARLELALLRTPTTPAFARGDKLRVVLTGGVASGGDLDTGVMVVDRIDSSFQPNIITIGCQSYDFMLGMKGRTDIAYQGSTLRNIVATQATFPNPDLTCDLTQISADIAGPATTDGGTDYRESASDRLALLQKLAQKYAYVFQMRSGVLTFRPYESVEGDASVRTIALTDCEPGASFDDNEGSTIATVYVEHNAAGFINMVDNTSQTTNLLDLRSEGWYSTAAMGTRRAFGAIKEYNNSRRVGRITVWGDARLVAGKNVTLDGTFWEWTGKWNITRATHRLSPSQGWRCSLELRIVNP